MLVCVAGSQLKRLSLICWCSVAVLSQLHCWHGLMFKNIAILMLL